MTVVLPPDEERAQIYKTKNFTEIKVLLPDGSVVDALPVTLNNLESDIDFKGLAFSIGLTLVISGANANVTVMYE